MNNDLLTKAINGDTAAHATLRRTIPASLTVFVAPGGKLDTIATLAAYQYYLDYQEPPDEWADEPTLTFSQAFPAKVKRDPLKLKPVTPGLWSRLWEKEPEMVAAIYWGVRTRNIQDSELELKGRVRRHLETPDSFLLDVLRAMKRDEDQAQDATNAVNAPVEQERIAVKIACVGHRQATAPKFIGLQKAITDLEDLYQRGGIDVGRYLLLKKDLETQVAAKQVWSHEKYIALGRVIREFFSLSEVQTLIFNMGLDKDDFPSMRNAAARELTQWAKRRGQLDKLSGMVKDANPSRWFEFASEWA